MRRGGAYGPWDCVSHNSLMSRFHHQSRRVCCIPFRDMERFSLDLQRAAVLTAFSPAPRLMRRPASCVLAYSNLLQIHPGFTLEVLQHILELRETMPKKEQKEAIAQCR